MPRLSEIVSNADEPSTVSVNATLKLNDQLNQGFQVRSPQA